VTTPLSFEGVGKRYGDRNQWRDGAYGTRYEEPVYRRSYDRDDHDRHDYRHADRRHDRGHGYGQAPRIHTIDRPFVARVDSHVRNGPAPGYRSVDVLRRGSRVHVVGRVEGTNWYMVSRRDRITGYVYAPLLDPLHGYSYNRGHR